MWPRECGKRCASCEPSPPEVLHAYSPSLGNLPFLFEQLLTSQMELVQQ